MIIGQTIFSSDESGTTYYTPWFPRGGDNAVFAFEIIAASNVDTLEVTPQTKNTEQADSAATSASAASIYGGSLGVQEWKAAGWSGCLELVRFKIVLTPQTGTLALAHIRALNPSWVTN